MTCGGCPGARRSLGECIGCRGPVCFAGCQLFRVVGLSPALRASPRSYRCPLPVPPDGAPTAPRLNASDRRGAPVGLVRSGILLECRVVVGLVVGRRARLWAVSSGALPFPSRNGPGMATSSWGVHQRRPPWLHRGLSPEFQDFPGWGPGAQVRAFSMRKICIALEILYGYWASDTTLANCASSLRLHSPADWIPGG